MIIDFVNRASGITLMEHSRMFKHYAKSNLALALLEPFDEGWQTSYERSVKPTPFMKFTQGNGEPFFEFTIHFSYSVISPANSTKLTDFLVEVSPEVKANIKTLAEARYVADMLRQFEEFKRDVEQCRTMGDIHRLWQE